MPTIKSCDTNLNQSLVDLYFPAIARTDFAIQRRRYLSMQIITNILLDYRIFLLISQRYDVTMKHKFLFLRS